MKARHKHIAAVALGALLIAGAAPAAGPAKPADQRAPLVLLDEERHIVLEEMRNFLAVLQTITDASGQVACSARNVVACVTAATLQPRRIPAPMMRKFQGGE